MRPEARLYAQGVISGTLNEFGVDPTDVQWDELMAEALRLVATQHWAPERAGRYVFQTLYQET